MLPTFFGAGQEQTVQQWEGERRGQIVRLFEEQVYGITPAELPAVSFVLEGEPEALCQGRVYRQVLRVELEKDGKRCGFRSRLFWPGEGDGPWPVAVMVNPFSRNLAVASPDREANQMPYEVICSQGYAAVHADVDEACLDSAEGYLEGLMELYPPEGDAGWGAIGAWAFLTSRLIDVLVTLPQFDAAKIAVCGCSRAGKAALWCAAQDARVALVISNVSGCTGAAITRGKTGEHIADITHLFPHWMCKNYAAYANREEELPVDQHMLLALAAPRPLYVSSASEDDWADPHMEWESLLLAGELYDVYQVSRLPRQAFPAAQTPLWQGATGYHLREGAHGCRIYDWEQFVAFMKAQGW